MSDVEQQWNDNDTPGKTEGLKEKPVPVPLCPPQIPHGLTKAQTWVTMITSQQPTN
jgi:hypothetical protein